MASRDPMQPKRQWTAEAQAELDYYRAAIPGATDEEPPRFAAGQARCTLTMPVGCGWSAAVLALKYAVEPWPR